MHLSPVLQRILTNLQLGPMAAIDLELAVYGTTGPEWSASTLRSHIARLNRAIGKDGFRVVSRQSYPPKQMKGRRRRVTGQRRTRGTYQLVPVAAFTHKHLDPEGVYVG